MEVFVVENEVGSAVFVGGGRFHGPPVIEQ